MNDARLDLPQGTLDLLILKALSLKPMHGWGISERIRQVSREMLQVPQGSLYPALHRRRQQRRERHWIQHRHETRELRITVSHGRILWGDHAIPPRF